MTIDAMPLFADARLPVAVAPPAPSADLAAYCRDQRDALDALLLAHGGILFRGFDVAGIEDFGRFAAAVSSERLDYVNRSTPRTELGENVYSATEYPANQEIPLHCENAYQRVWPLRVALACLTPAARGGRTPIADMRRVGAAITPALMDRFERLGVRYVRHYRPHVDLPWQVAFQTDCRDELADYCQRNGIGHEWLDEDTLRTEQVCQGTARHPVTGERVFFNQAHLFHPSSLPAAVADSLLDLYGTDGMPRIAYYGDGSDIADEDLEQIRAAHRSAAVGFDWRAGDVLLLDNMQAAHGRQPFEGARKVVAALMDAHAVA